MFVKIQMLIFYILLHSIKVKRLIAKNHIFINIRFRYSVQPKNQQTAPNSKAKASDPPIFPKIG